MKNKIDFNAEPCAVLSEILNIIKEENTEYIRDVNHIDVFRARPISLVKSVTKEDFAAPPLENAKSNRMSPKGVAYFYCSKEIDTPIKEIKSDKDKIVWITQWFIRTAQKIVSFIPFVSKYYKRVITKKIPSEKYCKLSQFNFGLYSKLNALYYDYSFLVSFANDLMKECNDEDLDYRATQAVTAFLKAELDDLNGVEYQSVKNDGVNYCLFLNHEESLDGKTLDFKYFYRLSDGNIDNN